MPAHVESVAWISGRYRRAVRDCSRSRRSCSETRAGERAGAAHVGGVIAFTLAVLAKEAALPFGAVIAIALWTRTTGASDEHVPAPDRAVRRGRDALPDRPPRAGRDARDPDVDRRGDRDAAAVGGLDDARLLRRVPVAVVSRTRPSACSGSRTGTLEPAVVGGRNGAAIGPRRDPGSASRAGARGRCRSRCSCCRCCRRSRSAISRGYVAFAERLVYLSSGGAAWGLGLLLNRFAGAGVRRSPGRVDRGGGAGRGQR